MEHQKVWRDLVSRDSRNQVRQRFHPATPHINAMAQSDEEDDYMNMTFEDAPKDPKYETSLQRAARKRKEVRSSVTSKVVS